METCKYYTYVLLNPLKRGVYKYGKYQFEYEPFYVGKGTRDRASWSANGTENFNNAKSRIINDLRKKGIKGLIIIIYKTKDQGKAYKREKKMVKLIGRLIDGNGPLTNATLGGGRITKITKEALNRKVRKWERTWQEKSLKQKDEIAKKISKALTGKVRSKAAIEKQRRKLVGRPKTKSHIEKVRLANIGKHSKNVTLNGRTKTIVEWAKEFNLRSSGVVYDRLRLGWPIKKAITTPMFW